MAGYDIFSSIQGPAVPVSLYGDAATAGINAGNALPTTATALIQGGLKGIEQGQRIVENQQQNEIRANQIEQLPVANRQAQVNLENSESIAAIHKARAGIASATQAIELETEKAKLESERIQAETKATDLTNQNAIIKDITTGGPLAKVGILNNPDYAATFSRDPEFANRAYANIYSDPNLPTDVRLKAKNLWDRNNDVEFAKEREKLRLADQNKLLQQYEKAQTDFLTDGVFANATRGLSPNEYFSKLEVYPKGTKQTDPVTGKIIRDAKDLPQGKSDAGDYTVYRDGTPIIDTINSSQADKFFLARQTRDAAERTLRQKIYGSPDAPATQQQQQQQAQAEQPSLSGNVGQPGSSNGNATIVEQRRTQFDELMKKTVPDLAGTTIERLAELKKRIRQGTVSLDKSRKDEISLLNLMENIRSQNDSFKNNPFESRTSFAYNSPDEALEAVAKQPVVLNIPTQYPLDAATRTQVDAEPLLQTLPPLMKGIMSVSLMKGLAAQESGGVRGAVSPTGVRGLLQVTKGTAAMYGMDRNIPEQNVLAGQLYLNDIYQRFNGDLRLTLAAYNAGPGVVKQAKDLAGTTDWEAIKAELKDLLSEKKYKEVSEYPDKVISKATQFMGSNPDDDVLFYGMLQNSNLVVPREA